MYGVASKRLPQVLEHPMEQLACRHRQSDEQVVARAEIFTQLLDVL